MKPLPKLFAFIGLMTMAALSIVYFENRRIDKKYDGKIIDSMTQWRTHEASPEKLIETARKAGVEKLVMFARMNRKYEPKNIKKLEKLEERNKDFLLLATPKYFKNNSIITDKKIDLIVSDIKSKKYKYVSELMLKHADKTAVDFQTEKGEYVVELDDPFLHKLIEKIISTDPGIAIQIHYELYNLTEDLDKLEAFLSRYSETKFVLSHMGFSAPEDLAPLMRRCKNLYVSISKKITKYNITRDPQKDKQVARAILDESRKISDKIWTDFLIEFQDKILFATDANYMFLWKNYEILIEDGRVFLGQLPLDIAQKIAYKNSENLYGIK